MSQTLEAALLDVRKAYRLLADYQQRMFELLGHIRERLGANSYSQQHAYPLLQKLNGLEHRNNSGMRYLPFFDLSAIWLKNGGQEEPEINHQPGDLMFGAWIRSDTGFDADSGKFTTEPELARSELVLSVVVCDKPEDNPRNWYPQIWCDIGYPADGKVNEDVVGYRCFSKAIPLARLVDRAAINDALTEWCSIASERLGLTIHAKHG